MTPDLDSTLSHLVAALTDFKAFLEAEASALASQDAATLADLLPRRNEMHRTLAGRWLALAQRAGTTEPKGLADLRTRLFGNQPPSSQWAQLEALVHASDRLNQVNGRLIEEQMRRTEVALQILRNSMAGRGIYGSDGRITDIHNQNRRIDSA